MDARVLGTGLLIGLCLGVTGCELFGPATGGPAGRDAQPAADAPPPHIVAGPAPPPTHVADVQPDLSGVDPQVAAYFNRVRAADSTEDPVSAPRGDQPGDVPPPTRFEPTIPVQRVSNLPADNWQPSAATRPPTRDEQLPQPELIILDREPPPAIDLTQVDRGPASSPPTTPPQLTEVLVNGSGAGRDFTSGRGMAPSGAAATANSGLDDVLSAVRAGTDGDDTFRAQLDQRIVQVIAGDYTAARQPLTLVTNEQQALAKSLIETLIVSREEFHVGNQDTAATKMNRELAQLVQQLGNVSDLAIPQYVICSINGVRGFGNYEPLSPAEFPAGQPIAIAMYCEVQHLLSELRGDGRYHSELAMTTTVLTHAGDVVLEVNDNAITDASHTQRRDFFIARPLRLPPTLAPGSYVVKVTIKDKLGQKVAQNRASLRVVVK
jgi:hypothetical protein